jgi:CheY-like chemotaxis protein
MSAGRQVLLVEDNILLAHLLRSALEDHGCRVTHAMKAREALQWLGSNEAQLVVLDDELPDGWGADIARAVRAMERRDLDDDEPHKPVPIIAMRTDADDGSGEPWTPDRQTILIRKPIQLSAFSALVRQYLDAAEMPEPVDVDLDELEDADPLHGLGEADTIDDEERAA